jgi:hypothetical protein
LENFLGPFARELRSLYWPAIIFTFEAIISVETFERNQKRLKGDGISKRIRRDITPDFPLRGLIVCAACGKHLTASWAKGRNARFAYYVCHNSSCEYYRKSLKRDEVENGFNALLRKTTLKAEVGKLLDVVFERVWNSEIGNLQKQETNAINNKKVFEEEIKKITMLAIATKSSRVRELYERQVEDIAGQLDLIDEESLDGIDFATPYRTALAKATILLKKPANAWKSMQIIEQHRLFFFIFEQKLAYDRNVGYRTANISSAARLFEQFVVENSPDVEWIGTAGKRWRRRFIKL